MRVSIFKRVLPDAVRLPVAIWLRKAGISPLIQSMLCKMEAKKLSRNAPRAIPSDSKILIICAHFNHLKFLPGCVESLLNQTHKNWQLIIVDDCSTSPGNKKTLIEQNNRDTRIKAISLLKNSGAYVARNTAVLAADSDWEHITFIDPDDVAMPDWIEHQLMVLAGREGSVRPMLERWDIEFSKKRSTYYGHCPSLHSKLAWKQAGGFLPVRWSGDAELTARLGHLSRSGLTAVYKGWQTAQRCRYIPGSGSHQDLQNRKVWLETRNEELSTTGIHKMKITPETSSWKDCVECKN